MPSIEKHYSFVCFLIDFYLRERFQEYTETNGVYVSKGECPLCFLMGPEF